MTMQLIETKTLTVAAATIVFTSIPQDGTDLVVIGSSRTNRANTINDPFLVRPNGSSANGTARRLVGNGSTVSSISDTYIFGGEGSTTSQTSNTFGNSLCYIPNYTSNTNKSFSTDGVGENNATSAGQMISAGLWSNTAAITSLTFLPESGTQFEIGTTISLYKITKGSGGATVS
jgi:hypothetical protein